MTTAKDFPVTLPYGSTAPPYGTSQYPYHRGVDYGAPEGCPIVVNGVQIGITGHTGFVTGPHVHVGRWVNGHDTDPGSGGWQLDNPRVTRITYDDVNGNQVGLTDAQGVNWYYLHMQSLSSFVKIGDYLNNLPQFEQTGGKGGDEPMLNSGDITNLYLWLVNRPPTNEDLQNWNGKPFKDLIYVLHDSQEFQQLHYVNDGDVVNMKAKGLDASGQSGRMWKPAMYASKPVAPSDAVVLKPGDYRVE